MAVDRDALRDWHRLFGLLLSDFFSGCPLTVEVERDLSEQQLLRLLERFQGEITMSYTMTDFTRDYFKEKFEQLTAKEQEEVLRSLLEQRLSRLSAEQIRQYLDQLAANRPAQPAKRRRKS